MSGRQDFKQEGDDDDEEIGDIPCFRSFGGLIDLRGTGTASLIFYQQYKYAKDAVLFAIDVSDSMLQVRDPQDPKRGEPDSAVSAALKSALALMQQRIISSPNDKMGILLFGTEQTKFMSQSVSTSDLQYPHCYLLTELNVPSAEDVRQLRHLIEDEKEFAKLMTPAEERVKLSDVLFYSNQIFAQQAPNFVSRRLFIVTDNEDPHPEKDLREAAEVRARDLYDLGVFIELFPIAKSKGDFDRSKFFNKIIYSAAPTDPNAAAPLLQPTRTAQSGDGLSLLNSLLSTIDSRSVPKRALFSNLTFELGPGLAISVNGYIIFKRQEIHKTSWVYVSEEKAMLAKVASSRYEDDDGKPRAKNQILKGYKFGGEHITFTPEEIESIRSFGEPIIRLLCFKSITAKNLPIWANTNRSTFIYPTEEGYVGSIRVFAALHQKLLTSNKMGVAWFKARKNATPVLVAILAGEEKFSDAGDQEIPAGLWMMPLPFADDIRTVPDHNPHVPASDDLVDKMRTVVQQLQLPGGKYVPTRYPNPSLQWHYRVLQAMALEDTLPEKPEDKTVPRYRQIHKRAGPYVMEWGKQLEDEYRIWQQGEGRKHATAELPKRPAAKEDAGAGPAKKKVKVEAEGPSDEDMRQAWKQDKVSKFTVADLKAFAARKSVQVSGGKKAEFLEAIEAWCEKQ